MPERRNFYTATVIAVLALTPGWAICDVVVHSHPFIDGEVDGAYLLLPVGASLSEVLMRSEVWICADGRIGQHSHMLPVREVRIHHQYPCTPLVRPSSTARHTMSLSSPLSQSDLEYLQDTARPHCYARGRYGLGNGDAPAWGGGSPVGPAVRPVLSEPLGRPMGLTS
jgi:hypothetical protein